MSAATVAAACRPAFARHETFHPRYGWLRKAVGAVERHPDAFVRPSAPVDLGVGKNMVNAIRYWGLAYKVLRDEKDAMHSRQSRPVASDFGTALLGEDGLDPFLEQEGSLWLLQWALMRPPCAIPTWWIAMNLYPRRDLREEGLAEFVAGQVSAVGGWPAVALSSIKKDISAMIRTFAPKRSGREGLDDLLDCPFRELHLMEEVADDGHTWRFAAGFRSSVPDQILGYAVMDFAARNSSARSVTIPTLASDPGGPGLCLRVSEDHIFHAMARLASEHQNLVVTEMAGLRQVLYDTDPVALAAELLTAYFRKTVDGRRRFPVSALPGQIREGELVR